MMLTIQIFPRFDGPKTSLFMKAPAKVLLSCYFVFFVSLAGGAVQPAPSTARAGNVFLQDEGHSMDAETPHGSLLNFQQEASASHATDSVDKPGPARVKPFRPGLRGIFELGYFGLGGGNYDELKLGLSVAYQINPFFLAGIGAGARKNPGSSGELTYPFFGFLRVSSVEQKVTPYFSLGIGNFFKRREALEEGGLFLSSTLGAKLNLSNRTSIYLGLGIEIQNERWTSNNSAGLNLGLIF